MPEWGRNRQKLPSDASTSIPEPRDIASPAPTCTTGHPLSYPQELTPARSTQRGQRGAPQHVPRSPRSTQRDSHSAHPPETRWDTAPDPHTGAGTPTPPHRHRRHPHRHAGTPTESVSRMQPRETSMTSTPAPWSAQRPCRGRYGGRDALAAKSAGWEAAAAGVETACDADPG